MAATDLNDPELAFREIDRVLEAVVRFRRPGYIELPRDVVNYVPSVSHRPSVSRPTSDLRRRSPRR